MNRRDVLTLLGGASAWPLAARAQITGKVPTIGYLAALSEAADRPRRTAFARRLGELGWVDGRSVRIEYRWADGLVARASEIAPEFVRLPVDVIVTSGDAYVLAVKRATAAIPISSSRRQVIRLATVWSQVWRGLAATLLACRLS